ncbi:MAG TPA: single-stranded DNA-binding protein [Patescibacteria group bacterium]
MASRASMNKVMLIGNLTRDPELRYTPQGTAVCTFGLATNRSWMPTDGGERREETEFHRIVSWNKLAELCSQLLRKGRKVYVEGRLQTRSWQAPDGNQRQTTEIVIEEMIILDSKRVTEEGEVATGDLPQNLTTTQSVDETDEEKKSSKEAKSAKPDASGKKASKEEKATSELSDEELLSDVDDLPF